MMHSWDVDLGILQVFWARGEWVGDGCEEEKLCFIPSPQEKECANCVRQVGLVFKITYAKISVMKITRLVITLSTRKMKI